MSRSGYSEDCDDQWALIRWRGQVASSIRGSRGQALLRDLAEALDAMPVKELISGELKQDGQFCTLGVVLEKRGMLLPDLDPNDSELVASQLNIAQCMAREVVFQNDEVRERDTPAQRWVRMRKWVDDRLGKKYAV